jgi:hypothetical protein
MAIMCCGCNGLLLLDGSTHRNLTVEKHGGLFSWSAVACFGTAEEGDAFASTHGWKVADEKGPNHRCPDCSFFSPEATAGARRGAYVPWGGPGVRD